MPISHASCSVSSSRVWISYGDLKTRAGALDFLDLLLKARDLVRDCAPVRRAFQDRFRYILVDEFQDTDPLQAEILMLLAGEERLAGRQAPGSRLQTSGPSQPPRSQTRPGAWSPEPGARLANRPDQARGPLRRRGPEAVDLPVPQSRRRHLPGGLRPARRAQRRPSRPPAHELPNRPDDPARRQRRIRPRDDARRRVAAGRLRRARTAPGGAAAPRARLQAPGSRLRAASGFRPAGRTEPGACSLEPAARRRPAKPHRPPRSRSLRDEEHRHGPHREVPSRCRRRVGALARAGERLDRHGAPRGYVWWRCRSSRATSASCSAASSKMRTDVTRPYVDALEARSVPHLLVGGRSFHDREEVETLRAALAAVEWPEDALNVYATLRGALFAIGEETLLEVLAHAPAAPVPSLRRSRGSRAAPAAGR